MSTSLPARTLGSSDLAVSTLGLGCNNLGRGGTATESAEGVAAIIDAAQDAGVTFLDVADVYGGTPGQSESMLGEALRGRREAFVIGTKFGMDLKGLYDSAAPRGSREYIRRAVEGSLTRLGVDRIDLYQYHQPDGVTPIAETLAALTELVDEGVVGQIGSSNFAGWMIAEADAVARREGTARFVSEQNHYSLLVRGIEQEVLPSAVAHGQSLIPYFPLQNGLLTGKYTRTDAPADGRITKLKPHLYEGADWDQLEAFSAFAAERGITEVVAAFGWLLARPAVATVIAGATRPEQLVQNAAAVTAWTPTAADLAALDAIFPPVRPAGGFR